MTQVHRRKPTETRIVARGACGCAWTREGIDAGKPCEKGCSPTQDCTELDGVGLEKEAY